MCPLTWSGMYCEHSQLCLQDETSVVVLVVVVMCVQGEGGGRGETQALSLVSDLQPGSAGTVSTHSSVCNVKHHLCIVLFSVCQLWWWWW